MHIAERVRSLSAVITTRLNSRAEELRAQGARVLNLGQTIPCLPHAPALHRRAVEALADPVSTTYSTGAGLLALRERLGATLRIEHGVAIDPTRELIITAGANQAFFLALLTLVEPGDAVLLPSPFFFSHEMAVRLAGAVPVEVPLRPETGFQLRWEDVAPYLRRRPRALVVLSPNNPTGAVYDPGELERIGSGLARTDTVVIADETYRHFLYGGARHLSLASLPAIRRNLVTVGSFSKSFNVTGWRVGYLLAQPAIVEAALKAQDAMVICAPTMAQRAVAGVLDECGPTLAQYRAILAERRQILADCLSRVPRLSWIPTDGGFFAFVRCQGCEDSMALAVDLLERAHIIAIPGRVCGEAGEGYLRLSYGSVTPAELRDACERLANYLA